MSRAMAIVLLIALPSCSGGTATRGGERAGSADEGGASFELVGQLGASPTLPVAVINDVIEPDGPLPWVAVGGWAKQAGDSLQPAVWVSHDGTAWHGGPIGEAAPLGEGDVAMKAVAAGSGRLVAVGLDSTSGHDRPAAWSSTDGLTWQRVRLSPALEVSRESRLVKVSGGPLGFFATGSATGDGTPVPVLWRSSDGHSWAQVATSQLAGKGLRMAAAVTQGPAGIVVVGHTGGGIAQSGATWFSPDGITWEASTSDPLKGNGARHLSDVSWTGTAYVAVGYELMTATRPFAWRSTDGRNWEQYPLLPTTTAPTTKWTTEPMVVPYGNGEALALVHEGQAPAMWASSGATWSAVQLPDDLKSRLGPLTAAGLASRGTQVLVAATHRGGPGLWLRDSAKWQRVLAGPDAVPDPLRKFAGQARAMARGNGAYVAVGSESAPAFAIGPRTDGVVWVSSDGASWRRLPENADFRDSGLAQVVFFKDRFIAAGVRSGSVAIWSSADGHAWSQISSSPALTLPGRLSVTSLLEAGPGLLLIGATVADSPTIGSDLVVLSSVDGRDWVRSAPDAALGGAGEQIAMGACVTPEEVIVVGAETKGGMRHAVSWRSQDGGRWTKVDVQPLGSASFAGGCIWTGKGVLAGGGDTPGGQARATFWSSAHGEAWTAAPLSPTEGGGGEVHRIERLGERFVAIGDSSGRGAPALGAWVSTDGGGSWQPVEVGRKAVPAALGETVVSSFVDDTALYALGSRGEGPQIWIGRALVTTERPK